MSQSIEHITEPLRTARTEFLSSLSSPVSTSSEEFATVDDIHKALARIRSVETQMTTIRKQAAINEETPS